MSIDTFDTEALPVVELATPPPVSVPPRRTHPVLRIVRTPRALTWLGLLVTVVGFVLIAVGWGQVASHPSVAEQMPYLVSAGVVGLGIVMVGITLAAIDAKLSDGRLRSEQNKEIATRLQRLLDAQQAQR